MLKKFFVWKGTRTDTIDLSTAALRLPKPVLLGVVRGLVAEDGSVDRRRKRIVFGVVSKKLAGQYAGFCWILSGSRITLIPPFTKVGKPCTSSM
jgi:hypothetical protein